MKRTLVAILWLLLALVATNVAQSKGWRDIVPLHSTRADVERLLGPPAIDRVHIIFYELKGEEVSFTFSGGPCSLEPEGWGVPRGTVTGISVDLEPHRLRLADLKLDEGKYKKKQDGEVLRYSYYIRGCSKS
jgi:hypothetical protein